MELVIAKKNVRCLGKEAKNFMIFFSERQVNKD